MRHLVVVPAGGIHMLHHAAVVVVRTAAADGMDHHRCSRIHLAAAVAAGDGHFQKHMMAAMVDRRRSHVVVGGGVPAGRASGGGRRRREEQGFRRSGEVLDRRSHRIAAAVVVDRRDAMEGPDCRMVGGELGSRHLAGRANAWEEGTRRRRRRPEGTGSGKELGSPAKSSINIVDANDSNKNLV